ncbi:MAG: hypothetical protein EOO16_07445 [Chitinophagaceae bacterium]|nr:MAG: hypothetical protein EOO16_07445 [Chitinophagaceae bacterium]
MKPILLSALAFLSLHASAQNNSSMTPQLLASIRMRQPLSEIEKQLGSPGNERSNGTEHSVEYKYNNGSFAVLLDSIDRVYQLRYRFEEKAGTDIDFNKVLKIPSVRSKEELAALLGTPGEGRIAEGREAWTYYAPNVLLGIHVSTEGGAFSSRVLYSNGNVAPAVAPAVYRSMKLKKTTPGEAFRLLGMPSLLMADGQTQSWEYKTDGGTLALRFEAGLLDYFDVSRK